MEQEFIDILKKLVKEQGVDALMDARKCKSLLPDYTQNGYKKESAWLVQAIDAGAARAIYSMDDLFACKKMQIRNLEEEVGLSSAVSEKVVNVLALVLRSEEDQKIVAAKAFYKKEEYDKAISLLQPLAEQGNSEAQWMLGDCYANGYGMENFTSPAEFERKYKELLQKSADQGNIDGQVLFASMFIQGEKAIEVYKKAADQGNTRGLYKLGYCYAHGEGVKQDKEKAVEFWQKAMNQGDESLKDLLYVLKKKIEIDKMVPRPAQGRAPFAGDKIYEGDIAGGKPCENGKGKILKPDGSVTGEVYFINGKAYV